MGKDQDQEQDQDGHSTPSIESKKKVLGDLEVEFLNIYDNDDDSDQYGVHESLSANPTTGNDGDDNLTDLDRLIENMNDFTNLLDKPMSVEHFTSAQLSLLRSISNIKTLSVSGFRTVLISYRSLDASSTPGVVEKQISRVKRAVIKMLIDCKIDDTDQAYSKNLYVKDKNVSYVKDNLNLDDLKESYKFSSKLCAQILKFSEGGEVIIRNSDGDFKLNIKEKSK